jgi:hypothetical protein
MSGTDWNELERAWQSLPANASPVVEELKRARRWQWWSHVYLAGEIVIGIAGFAAAGWLFWRGGTFSIVMGLATIVFVAVTGGTSLWARLLPHARSDDPVMQSVAAAVRRVEFGLRLARATLWALCAALGYLAVFAASVSQLGDGNDIARGYVAIAVALVWLGVVLAGTLVYQKRREGDLARLKGIEASLRGEV